jgi:hypothetical protein
MVKDLIPGAVIVGLLLIMGWQAGRLLDWNRFKKAYAISLDASSWEEHRAMMKRHLSGTKEVEE